MKSKKQPAGTSAKQKWQTERAPYTWHLNPPFAQEFDRQHWWKGLQETDPVAALYELARRHPRIGELRTRFRHASWYGLELRALSGLGRSRMLSFAGEYLKQEPEVISCLCQIGLKSWPMLGEDEIKFWRRSAGNIKGVECRTKYAEFHSITEDARMCCFLKRWTSMPQGKDHDEFWSLLQEISRIRKNGGSIDQPPAVKFLQKLNKLITENPVSDAEMEASVANFAIKAHRDGKLVFAIAPDLKQDRAEGLLAEQYREDLKRLPRNNKRSRTENWLPLIAVFEDDSIKGGIVKTDVFLRYRRVIDRIWKVASIKSDANPPS